MEVQLLAMEAHLRALGSIITLLEVGVDPPTPRKRRGRKSMNAEERARVSARMKKMWAGRKAAAA